MADRGRTDAQKCEPQILQLSAGRIMAEAGRYNALEGRPINLRTATRCCDLPRTATDNGARSGTK